MEGFCWIFLKEEAPSNVLLKVPPMNARAFHVLFHVPPQSFHGLIVHFRVIRVQKVHAVVYSPVFVIFFQGIFIVSSPMITKDSGSTLNKFEEDWNIMFVYFLGEVCCRYQSKGR